MIQRLKHQQEKLLISERHEAWSSVARKLAHEIKNPLTPIQLIIDNLRSKYLNNIEAENKEKYDVLLCLRQRWHRGVHRTEVLRRERERDPQPR